MYINNKTTFKKFALESKFGCLQVSLRNFRIFFSKCDDSLLLGIVHCMLMNLKQFFVCCGLRQNINPFRNSCTVKRLYKNSLFRTFNWNIP